MTDRYDEKLILDYVEGDLSAPELARFEQALGEDALLRGLVEDLVRQRRGLRDLPDEPAPPQIMEAIRQRLERDMLLEPPPPVATGPVRRLMLMRWAVAGGIAAVIAIATLVVVIVLGGGPGGPPAGPASNQVALGGKAAVPPAVSVPPAAAPLAPVATRVGALPGGEPEAGTTGTLASAASSSPAGANAQMGLRDGVGAPVLDMPAAPAAAKSAPAAGELGQGKGRTSVATSSLSLTLQTPDLAGGEDKLMTYCAQNQIALVRRLDAGRTQQSQVRQNGTIHEPGRGARVEFTLQVPRGQVPALLAQVSLWGSATVEAQVGGDGSGPGEPLGLALDHAAGNAGANTATQPKVLAVEADARARRGAEPQASISNSGPMELQQSGAEPGRAVAGQDAAQNVAATPAPQVEASISRGGAPGAAPAKPDDREIVSLRVILVEAQPEARPHGK